MLVYHYDMITKEYKKNTEAYTDPLEPSRYILPAHATFLEPPQDDKTYLFVNNEWIEKEPEPEPTPEPTPESPIDYWAILRNKRDLLLLQTDFMFLSDYIFKDESYKQKVVIYRQALRDLPSNTINPMNVVYPTLE